MPAIPPLEFIGKQLENAAEERQALVASFERSVNALRRDLWLSSIVSIVLLAIIILARDGVFARVGLPGVTIETRSAAAAEKR